MFVKLCTCIRCMYIECISVYQHVYVCADICVQGHTVCLFVICVCVCVCVCMYVCVCVYICVYGHIVCLFLFFLCVCVCVCMYVCVCVCVPSVAQTVRLQQ